MLHPMLVEDLSNLPPEDWAKTLRRFEWLKKYYGGTCNRSQLLDGARYLGVSERYLRKLFDAHTSRLAGGPSKFPSTGFQRSIDEKSEIAIASAIASAGPSATESMVYREAARMGALNGAVISKSAVRTRFGKGKAETDLGARFRCTANTFLDVCGLGLNVELPNGAISTAMLVAAIRGADGFVKSFRLLSYADLTADKHLTEYIKFTLEQDARVQLTSYLENFRPTMSQYSLSMPTLQGGRGKRTVRSGMAIRATFGRKIGRIITRVSESTWDNLAPSPSVELETATIVVRYLIDHHNARDRTLDDEASPRWNGHVPETFALR